MMFRFKRRRNPFYNPFLTLLGRFIGIGGMCVAVYFSLVEGTLSPLYVAFAVLTILEMVLFYSRLWR